MKMIGTTEYSIQKLNDSVVLIIFVTKQVLLNVYSVHFGFFTDKAKLNFRFVPPLLFFNQHFSKIMTQC